jgi:hypothetical protein
MAGCAGAAPVVATPTDHHRAQFCQPGARIHPAVASPYVRRRGQWGTLTAAAPAAFDEEAHDRGAQAGDHGTGRGLGGMLRDARGRGGTRGSATAHGDGREGQGRVVRHAVLLDARQQRLRVRQRVHRHRGPGRGQRHHQRRHAHPGNEHHAEWHLHDDRGLRAERLARLGPHVPACRRRRLLGRGQQLGLLQLVPQCVPGRLQRVIALVRPQRIRASVELSDPVRLLDRRELQPGARQADAVPGCWHLRSRPFRRNRRVHRDLVGERRHDAAHDAIGRHDHHPPDRSHPSR